MSTSPEASPVNGHSYSSPDRHSIDISNGALSDADAPQSESDLSDVQAADHDLDAPSSESDAEVDPPSEKPDRNFDQVSGESNNDASDDGDFDVPDSPASAQSNNNNSRAGSTSSRHAAKRKAAQAMEEDFMRENPELYGLRRSV